MKNGFYDEVPNVDFDFLHMNTGINDRATAGQLALMLVASLSVDELLYPNFDADSTWDSYIGGGCSMNMRPANQSIQRASLANHFALFSSCKLETVHLTKAELICLRTLRTEMQENFWEIPNQPYKTELFEKNIALLTEVIRAIEERYVMEDPAFIVEILCREEEAV